MIGFKYKFAALCCLAAVFSWSPSPAQEVPKRPTVTSPAPAKKAALGNAVVRQSGTAASQSSNIIKVSLNQVEVITLPRAVGRIVIGNETVARFDFDPQQPNKVYIVARAIGSTNVFFLDANGDTIQQFEVVVTFDSAGIRAALAKLLPDEKIDISVYRDSIFLSGKVSKATAVDSAVNIASRFVEDVANVVNMLTVTGGQQVVIKVRVAEIDREIRKNLTADTTLTTTARTSRPRFSVTGTSPTTIDAFGAGTLFLKTFGLDTFGPTTFSALEENKLVKVLAEPTLTAISGETASFLAGGEFPFPSQIDESGTAFEFREFGIRLDFTPVVLDNGLINLQISTEISSLGGTVTINNLDFQSLSQKRTETTVELPSGGTIMISGLLEDNITDTIRGVPFLKDIPILGALFRSTDFLRQETELIITVTAYVVKPIDNVRSVAMPTDGFEAASDIDHYLLGRLQHHYGKTKRSPWAKNLKGPFGYIMK